MAMEQRNLMETHRPPPLPEDFGERLERLKELIGVSWGEFAELCSA